MTRPSDRALFDELLASTHEYRNSAEYLESLRVVAALRDFSPFNAYLLRVQRPKLRYAASVGRWKQLFGRTVRTDRPAYPLIIMRPFGPVDFVFDLEDTQGPPLPPHVLEPIRTSGYVSSKDWEQLFRNARRRGIRVEYTDANLDSYGSIEPWADPTPPETRKPKADKQAREEPPVRYRVVLNGGHSHTTQFVTLLHEMAHLTCGHLGAWPSDDWPDRTRMPLAAIEFEAESVAFIVCRRLGLKSSSETYLAGYVDEHAELPSGVSVYTVLRAAGLLHEWTSKLTWPRKPRKEAAEQARRAGRANSPQGRAAP